MKKIAIVILNWNNYQDTKKCLDSILATDKLEDIELFLIDNNSEDGSGNKLEAEYKGFVHFYNTGMNGGYTGGNNFGIKKALEYSCDYILVLNNDLKIDNFLNIISSIRNCYDFDKNIGIIGFEIYDMETKNIINVENKTDLIFNKLLNIKSNEILKIGSNETLKYKRTVCGCAICFRRECIEDIGMFNESFFMYAEEHDISLRAIKNNWSVVKLESDLFRIYRKVDPITEKQLIWYYGTRNIFYVYKNNLNSLNYLLFSTIQIIIYFKQIVKYYFIGEKEISRKIFLGLKDYFRKRLGRKNED